MTFYMHPTREAEYRAARFMPSSPQRYCAGCKKRRSTNQFAGEAVKCRQCERRGL